MARATRIGPPGRSGRAEDPTEKWGRKNRQPNSARKNGLYTRKCESARTGRIGQDSLKLARSLMRDKTWTRHAIAGKIGVSHMTLFRELRRAQLEQPDGDGVECLT